MVDFWFSPFGRTARADYWYWLVLPYVISVVLAGFLGPGLIGRESSAFFVLLFTCVFFVSHLAIAIKRLHDVGTSGWYSAALIIPFGLAIAYLAQPDRVDISALDRASDEMRLVFLAAFSAVFAPFAYVLGLIWFVMGTDGKNRYGYDPLYR
jgi:uncharacterized membrane protein YhaH (DUF805 family)